MSSPADETRVRKLAREIEQEEREARDRKARLRSKER
jgi:hypothetical protein